MILKLWKLFFECFSGIVERLETVAYVSEMGELLFFAIKPPRGCLQLLFRKFCLTLPVPFLREPAVYVQDSWSPPAVWQPRTQTGAGVKWKWSRGGGKLFSPATLCVGSKQVLLVFCAAAADRFWQLHLHQTTAGSWLECTLHKNNSSFSVEVFIYSDVFVK